MCFCITKIAVQQDMSIKKSRPESAATDPYSRVDAKLEQAEADEEHAVIEEALQHVALKDAMQQEPSGEKAIAENAQEQFPQKAQEPSVEWQTFIRPWIHVNPHISFSQVVEKYTVLKPFKE